MHYWQRAVELYTDNYEAEMHVEAKDTFSRAKSRDARLHDEIPPATRRCSAFIACARPRVPSVFLPDMVSPELVAYIDC